jgi:hypothetical protein
METRSVVKRGRQCSRSEVVMGDGGGKGNGIPNKDKAIWTRIVMSEAQFANRRILDGVNT